MSFVMHHNNVISSISSFDLCVLKCQTSNCNQILFGICHKCQNCLNLNHVSPIKEAYNIISEENLAARFRPSRILCANERGFVLCLLSSSIRLWLTGCFRRIFLCLLGVTIFTESSWRLPGGLKYGEMESGCESDFTNFLLRRPPSLLKLCRSRACQFWFLRRFILILFINDFNFLFNFLNPLLKFTVFLFVVRGLKGGKGGGGMRVCLIALWIGRFLCVWCLGGLFEGNVWWFVLTI